MMLVLGVVAGLVLLGMLLAFVLTWRGQTLASKDNERLYKGHEDIIEYLVIASNPVAWAAKQADKVREDRKARQTDEDEREFEGVF